MGWRVYWKLCQKHSVSRTDVWYKEVPDEFRLWDSSVKATRKLARNRSDVTELD